MIYDLNLWSLNVRGWDFRGAVLIRSNFQEMDLLEADFQGANLYESNFQGADLEGVKFDGTDLSDVNLDKVRNFTQDQLNTIIYQFEYPPKNLTELDLPEHRAFTYNDTDQRVFVTSEYSESDQLVDEVLEKEREE